MIIQDITDTQKTAYNSVVNHPLQAFEWGEFRKKTGVRVIRKGIFEKDELIDGFQLTIHPIPRTPWTIGYLPKGKLPSPEIIKELRNIGKDEKCIFIQLEPNVEKSSISDFESQISNVGLRPSAHPLFTKYTFTLDLTPSEEELLKNMHHKTRYNIRVAQKHGVVVAEDNSDQAFETYLQLTQETTKRQQFYAHTQQYHRLMWETLQKKHAENEGLTAHLFLAKHQPDRTQQSVVLAAWIVFVFHDTIYYPYGASSSEHRKTMASNLMMWEIIRFGKKQGMKYYDMWGALGPDPDSKNPWYGFHRFKQGYGARHTEFIGSYDLIINPHLYPLYKAANTIRWPILRLKKFFS